MRSNLTTFESTEKEGRTGSSSRSHPPTDSPGQAAAAAATKDGSSWGKEDGNGCLFSDGEASLPPSSTAPRRDDPLSVGPAAETATAALDVGSILISTPPKYRPSDEEEAAVARAAAEAVRRDHKTPRLTTGSDESRRKKHRAILDETRHERDERTTISYQLRRPSPVFVAHGWPHRSPDRTPPPPAQDGEDDPLGRTLEGGDGSCTSSSNTTTAAMSHPHPHRHHHGQVVLEAAPYSLMAHSFDTFSADGGGGVVVPGTYGEGDDGRPLPLDYRHPHRGRRHQDDDTYPSSFVEGKLNRRLSPAGPNETHEALDHSPPQRVIHLDTTANAGDGGGAFGGGGDGDISPIALDGDGGRDFHHDGARAGAPPRDGGGKPREVLFLECDSSSNSHREHHATTFTAGRPWPSSARPGGAPIGPYSTRTSAAGRFHTHRVPLQGTPAVANERDAGRRATVSYHPDGLPPRARRSDIHPSPLVSRRQHAMPSPPYTWRASYPYQDHPHYQVAQQHYQYHNSLSNQAHQQQYSHGYPSPPNRTADPTNGGQYYYSNPFFVLRSFRMAFDGCSYLLACLQDHPVCPVNVSAYGGTVDYEEQQTGHLDPEDLEVATCRIQATICALGGYIIREANDVPMRSSSPPTSSALEFVNDPSSPRPPSIFRPSENHRRGRLENRHGPIRSPAQALYMSRFHQRYFVGGNKVSWEVEERPPVVIPSEEVAVAAATNKPHNDDSRRQPRGEASRSEVDKEQSDHTKPVTTSEDADSADATLTEQQQKMKYRCKLCGQPKQNHSCPYQQSLQRSIAVMVDPTVHAYSSAEPGILTHSISDMNNFVSYGDGFGNDGDAFDEQEGTREDQARLYPVSHVTPEYNKVAFENSPETSTLSSINSPGFRRKAQDLNAINQSAPRHDSRKRHIEYGNGDLGPSHRPAPGSLVLRQEHFRAVTPQVISSKSKADGVSSSPSDHRGDFDYPHVPLSFQGRKRLSDTLFFLSKDIPTVTGDVASLLRTAREEDEWDLAVAEILTQVVVGLYCSEGDHRLDGLRTYLLNIGISS